MMEAAELDLIRAFLRPEAVMFEFGSGGSTVAFGKQVRRLFSAEHAPVWAETVQQQCDALGLRHVTMLSAPPDRAVWERLGCTAIGIFEPTVCFPPAKDPRVCYGPNCDPRYRDASLEDRSALFAEYLARENHGHLISSHHHLAWALSRLACTRVATRNLKSVGILQSLARPASRDSTCAAQSRLIAKLYLTQRCGCVVCGKVVFIDGRARGECALAALPFVDDDSVVIIHDWALKEKGYRIHVRAHRAEAPR